MTTPATTSAPQLRRPTDVPAAPATTPPRRIASVDALRALVMLTMLFVNDVAGVGGTPWWMQHYHPYDASGMTFVDLVFPAFLFLVGMSIPLSLRGRIARGESTWRILAHILTRGLSLLLIGVLMVNMPANARHLGWPPGLWDVLTLSAVFLAFHAVPTPTAAARRNSLAIRLLGFAAIAYLAWTYHGPQADHLRTSWWGILGLIGWAYMIATLLYLPLRRSIIALLTAAAALLTLRVLDAHHLFDGLTLRSWVTGSHVGSHPAITMAGVALATTLTRPTTTTARRLAFAAALAVGSALGAVALHGYGINKNAATPSWCLWSIAISAALWIPFHLLLDLRLTPPRWAPLLTHAGGNALLAYIASGFLYRLFPLLNPIDRLYASLGHTFLPTGFLRSLTFATLLLTLCALLDRARIRLKV